MDNPLLLDRLLPAFTDIRAEHVVPAIESILKDNRLQIETLLQAAGSPDWEHTLIPMEALQDRLHRAWSPVAQLHAVADHTALRKAHDHCLPLLTEYETWLAQHPSLLRAYRTIARHPDFPALSTERRKVVQNRLRDFRLSGCALPSPQQHQLTQIRKRLSLMQSRFEANLLDATNDWSLHIPHVETIVGLPQTVREFTRENAQIQDRDGWIFTLDAHCYEAVMDHARDTGLRQSMYHAYHTRASDLGPSNRDNSSLMRDILKQRTALARLLGFPSYAHYALETRMAKDPKEVLDFLRELATHSRSVAQREYRELCQFARDKDGKTDLEAWDVRYYSEQLLQSKHAFSQENLRPYFPLSTVLQGLFAIVERLFGLRIEARSGVELWHETVVFYDVRDESDTLRGSFYLDPYARKGKRSGAWMDECVVRRRSALGIQHPVAYLNCNFTPPANEQHEALLRHDEVVTLFHEFGHGLQHILTTMEHPDVSGINGIPWDAVELPSQFMENLCWEQVCLTLLAKHHETGAALSDEMCCTLRATKIFQSGMAMVRQLELALFDFRLHLDFASDENLSITALLKEVRAEVAVVPTPDCNRFQHGFSHIFSGGYAAGYYSYKWAEMLSADVFSRFAEGGVLDRSIGLSFLRNFLEPGGSVDPEELFIRFRGRKPDPMALLRDSGLSDTRTKCKT